MNQKMRGVLVLVAGLCLLLTALAALAAGGAEPGHDPGPGVRPQPLTPEQEKTALDIRQKHEKVLFDIHQKLARLRLDLRAAMDAPQPDPKRVQGLSADIGKLLGQRLAEHATERLELRKAGLPERPPFGPHGHGFHGFPGPCGMGPGLVPAGDPLSGPLSDMPPGMVPEPLGPGPRAGEI